MKDMKDKKSKIGFPKEFAIYIPKMSSEEQRILEEQKKNFQIDDSLVKVRDYVIGLLPNLPTPSDFLVFALGKILFSISDYDALTILEEEFSCQGLDLWKIRLLLRRGLSEEAIKRASAIFKKEDISFAFKLHSLRSIANGYLNLGNHEQCRIYLNELFEVSLTSPKLSADDKPIINDILLEAHKDNFFLNRYSDEKIKLENKINVALQISADLGDRNHLGSFYYLMALLQRDSGKLDDSIKYSNQAIALFKETGNVSLLYASKGNLGTINVIKGNLDEAESIYIEILKTFRNLEENRFTALSIKSLGNIAIERGNYEEAIEKYHESLNIIEQLNLKEPYQYCILAELFLQTGRLSDFEILIKNLEEEVRGLPSSTIEAYILFLKGLNEIKKLNYGKASEYFSKALVIADRRGSRELSAKILMNTILLNINKYDVEKNVEELDLAIQNISHILPYFIESNLIKEQVALRLLEGKIFAIKQEHSPSFNSLQKARDLLQHYKNKQLLQMVNKYLEALNNLESSEELVSLEWVNEPFRSDVYSLEDIGIRYMQRSHVQIEIAPLALILLHRSGIPLRSFVISKRTVKDQLLFGGFIVAIRDMLSELFEGQKSQMLVITYGNYKIIIEAHPKGFSSVAISANDSFSLRRKIHQLTEKLSEAEIPRQYYGDLSQQLSTYIDKEVESLFGPYLVYSDAIQTNFKE
ncbi:MAG: tetratricopeptide repeat protein [Candidatus Heimdallarchaeota archaeon]|nr:tetratricopeptide repeat protein [Candidatus Heimdallarchaeota archaeon]